MKSEQLMKEVERIIKKSEPKTLSELQTIIYNNIHKERMVIATSTPRSTYYRITDKVVL